MLEEGEGLGVWSGTACESSHSAFRDTYTRFKGQESYLMKACCEYNKRCFAKNRSGGGALPSRKKLYVFS